VARQNSFSPIRVEGGYSAAVSALVFIGFVIAGCAYIILAKLFGMEQVYVTFVPIAAMLAYALLITLARSLRLRDDQSGDNLYYMGFLFTLTSLGVSLYQFSASRAAEDIVQNFGIAIGSTIAGIGLRVVFNQMRRDPVEVERTMRLELAEAARRVRRELDSAVVEFGYFRRFAEQSATDSFRGMTEAFDELLARFFARLEDITKTMTLPVEGASNRTGAAIDAFSETVKTALADSAGRLSAETDKLSHQATGIAAALGTMTVRLNALPMPVREIEERLEPVVQLLSQAVEQMKVNGEGQAKAVTEAFSVATAAAASTNELTSALRQEFDAAASANRNTLEATAAVIKAAAEELRDVRVNSRDYTEALRMMLERSNDTMRTFTDVLVQSSAEQAAWTSRLADALAAIEAKVQTLADAAERITLTIEHFQYGPARRQPERIE
jgi:hypothetical protein